MIPPRKNMKRGTNMKTLKIEVKTEYSIRFDFHDFCKIFAEAKNDPCRIGAFDNFNLDDTTMGNIRDCFHSLDELSLFAEDHGKQKTKNIQYIANKLGFDKVANYGMMLKDKDEYWLSVYNWGADL